MSLACARSVLGLVALVSLLLGCSRGRAETGSFVLVKDASGKALPGVLVEVDDSFRAYTDEGGRVRVPPRRGAKVRVSCPRGLSTGEDSESVASGNREVVCRPLVVEVAVGVLVDEATVATVLLDGAPLGTTENGAFLTVVERPAFSRSELALVDERGEARFGPARLLSVGAREQLFLMEAAVEAPRRAKAKKGAPPRAPVAPRPYRVGR